MKILGNGFEIVWGVKEGKPIAQFQNGIFETKDEKLIRQLIHLGYKTDDEGTKQLNSMNKKQELPATPAPHVQPEGDTPDSSLPGDTKPVREPDETIQQYAARIKAWKKEQKEKSEEQGDE